MDSQHKTELNQQAAENKTGVEESLERLSWVEEDLANTIGRLETKLDSYLVPLNEQKQQGKEHHEMQSHRAEEIQNKYIALNNQVRRLQSIIDRFDG